MTTRYKAPKRAKGLPHCRAEGVFALECIYLEMYYVMVGRSLDAIFIPDRYQYRTCSYE